VHNSGPGWDVTGDVHKTGCQHPARLPRSARADSPFRRFRSLAQDTDERAAGSC